MSKLPKGPVGELSATLSQPTVRTIIDIKLDPNGLTFESNEKHDREGRLEFVLIAFDVTGRRINYLDKGFRLHVRADQHPAVEMKGFQTRFALDLPLGPGYLRLAVRDLISNRVGSLELQYVANEHLN